jgi:hypothetical protein
MQSRQASVQICAQNGQIKTEGTSKTGAVQIDGQNPTVCVVRVSYIRSDGRCQVGPIPCHTLNNVLRGSIQIMSLIFIQLAWSGQLAVPM